MKFGKRRYKHQRFVDIDFETRSLGDIKVLGAMKYAEHPSTEILMVSWRVEGKKKTINWNPFTSKKKAPYSMLQAIERGDFVSAFNSEFEYWIWRLVGTRQFGWPKVSIKKFYDVMGQSCASAFPANLHDSAIACRADHLKNEEGKALIRFFCVPITDTQEFRDPLEFPEKFSAFIEYCNDDVNAQVAIREKTATLSPAEQNIMFLTEMMNVRGIPINMPFVRGALNMVNIAQRRMDKRARVILKQEGNLGAFHSLSQREKVKQWVNDRGTAIPDMKKETIQNWIDEGVIEDDLSKEILAMRLQHAKSSTAKYRVMYHQTDKNGFIHGTLKYHIARTGRFGGRGLQVQNITKPGKTLPKTPGDSKAYDKHVDQLVKAICKEDVDWLLEYHPDIMETLAGYVRASIMAPPGKKFVVADYGQIEARIVLFLAGSKNGMKDFGGEGKVYEAMAATIYGLPLSKIAKDSRERFIGKQTVLGSGFGMGWKKFITSCWDVAQVRVDDATAKKAIEGYRARYHEVPELWKKSEAAAIKAVQNKGKICRVNKYVSYQMRGKHLYCQLPSGRELTYPFAQVKMAPYFQQMKPKLHFEGKCSFSQKWKLLDTYGGSLCVSGDTEVLSESRGWIKIEEVTPIDKIYDGEFFVKHDGVAYQGDKDVISYKGIYATPDHRFLDTDNNWREFHEIKSQNCNWAEVQLPDCSEKRGRFDEARESNKQLSDNQNTSHLGYALRLREKTRSAGKWFVKERLQEFPAFVWMQSKLDNIRSANYPRNVKTSNVCSVAKHESTLYSANSQSLSQLWGQGHKSIQAVAGILPELLGRYARKLQDRVNFGQEKQQRELQQTELQMGDNGSATGQQEEQHSHKDTKRDVNSCRSREGVWHTQLDNDLVPSNENSKGVIPVFDLINCGPRHRFAVRTVEGKIVIAHNCENFVQAIARDVMCHGMINTENAGYETCFSVHDEAIALVDEDFGSYQEYEELLCDIPRYLEGCPIVAEGFEGRYYKK